MRATLGAGCYWYVSSKAFVGRGLALLLSFPCIHTNVFFVLNVDVGIMTSRGTENYVKNKWGKDGKVTRSAVGFMGGPGANPSYEAVCSGRTVLLGTN
jgi:hypothetical protein